ncbi:serine carboxypeptidase 49-like protein [Trifolium pratense]|uniref:Carboxypeptidase n=1 Tax=Trifolium pratense TaxID=57577 RepID=A0A2K3NYK4_TRIPR|nr:serine carboxypeptidase 49-like protein [Trifolium pratense]
MGHSSSSSSTSTFLIFNLLFLFFSISTSSTATADLRLTLEAKKLVRDLNLFPEVNLNIATAANSSSSLDPHGGKIVEKRLKFPNLINDDVDDVSVEDLGHYAGYYPIQHSHAAKMFYFFFESRDHKEAPVVIWLTGGPGCSSELALFYENGPFKINDNLSLVWNEYGWDKVSNLLYVDQPTGTGFSYSTDLRDMRHDEKGVSNDLYDFLQAFFAEHPQYAKNDFFITGESYAGHYIPALASRIHQGNQASEGIHINLKGFAIGNGLTDPLIQYKAYPDFALDMGLISKGTHTRLGLVLVPACELAIKLCGTDGKAACLAANVACNLIFNDILLHAGNINVGKQILPHLYYDIRKKCEGSLCYDFSNMEKFLDQQSVRDSLGVGKIRFVSCSTEVYAAMLVDWMRNLEVGIPALLDDGIKLLVYAGEYDLICNWLGNSRWVHAMKWSGQKEFVASPDAPFIVNGSEAGLLKNYGPLSFLKVHDAGHMVPMDQPKAALEMLTKWTRGTLAESISGEEKLVADM